MTERERIPLGNGIAVYRQYQTWILEVSRNGERARKSLGTREKGVAVSKAGSILQELKRRKAEIDSLECEAAIGALPLEDQQRIRENAEKALARGGRYLISLPQNPGLKRLGDAARDGLDLYSLVNKAAQAGSGKAEPKPSTPESVLKQYKESLEDEGLDSDHIGIVVSIIKHFLDGANAKSLADLTEEDVRKHLRSLKSVDDNGDATLKKKLKRIVNFLDFAKAPARGYLAENVAAGIKPRKVKPPDNDCYSKKELEAIFRRVAGHLIEPVVLMAFWTGLDRMDLEILDAEDIKLDARRIIGRRHKTNKKRRDGVPIFDALLEVVKKLPREGRVFAHWKNLESVGKQANEMGIDFRKLRRSFVSHLRLQNVNPDVVCRWACHTREVEEDYVCPTGEPMIFTSGGAPIPPHGHLEVPKSVLQKVD